MTYAGAVIGVGVVVIVGVVTSLVRLAVGKFNQIEFYSISHS